MDNQEFDNKMNDIKKDFKEIQKKMNGEDEESIKRRAEMDAKIKEYDDKIRELEEKQKCNEQKKIIEIPVQKGHVAFQVAAALLTGGVSIIIAWETERALIKKCENIMEQMGGCDCDKK